ncbi:MAG: hypothetical protein M0Q38_13040 [Bacteroidales bacterium]|nr:hypothetical protein [Bacteroidales bacterium]
MRNSFLLVFLIFIEVQTSAVFAQNRFAANIEGGHSYTYIFGNSVNSDCLTPILGGFGGIAFQNIFLDKLAIKAGIAYERKGIELRIKNQYALSLEIRDHYGLVNTLLFPVFVGEDGKQYNSDRKSINNEAS